jgi:hypothetical protein
VNKLSVQYDMKADAAEKRIKRCEDEGHRFSICAREHNDAVIAVWREAARMAREVGH